MISLNPTTEFHNWLESAYAQLEALGDPEYGDVEMDIVTAASIVTEASEKARRVGAGHLAIEPDDFGVYKGQPIYHVTDAQSDLGRMLLWCREQVHGRTEAPPPTVNHDGPYSVAEASLITRVSKRKLYQDISDGKIRHSKKPIRITKEDLDEYQRDREQQPVKTSDFRHLT